MSIDNPGGEITVTLEASVRFGPFTYRWTEPAQVVAAATSASLALSIPREGFLHDLARDYVTTLRVRARATDGLDLVYIAPPRELYVGWPDGPDGSPVVWDTELLATRAPGGSSTLRWPPRWTPLYVARGMTS